MRTCGYFNASFWGVDNSWIKATQCRFDERLDSVGCIYSLPFIRNHDFARNGTKGLIFMAFRVFSKAFHKMLKKETVNLSLKYAILCLSLCLVHCYLTNHFFGDCLLLRWTGTPSRIFLSVARSSFWPARSCNGTLSSYFLIFLLQYNTMPLAVKIESPIQLMSRSAGKLPDRKKFHRWREFRRKNGDGCRQDNDPCQHPYRFFYYDALPTVVFKDTEPALS